MILSVVYQNKLVETRNASNLDYVVAVLIMYGASVSLSFSNLKKSNMFTIHFKKQN